MKKLCDVYCFKGNKNDFGRVGFIVTDIDDLEGVSKDDTVYISSRKIQEHYFRIFKGYGLSVIVYNQLIHKNVTKVIIHAGEDYLLSNFSQWRKSNRWVNETLDGQIDNQYILEEFNMRILKGGELIMTNVSDFVKASGSFLSAKDVLATPTAIFIITSEGKIVKSEKFQTEKLQVEGEYNKVSKTFDLSKTNARVIADKLGDDTVKWIGHQLILETYRTKTSDGKMTDAINVKEVR